jgi:hypothetical protein
MRHPIKPQSQSSMGFAKLFKTNTDTAMTDTAFIVKYRHSRNCRNLTLPSLSVTKQTPTLPQLVWFLCIKVDMVQLCNITKRVRNKMNSEIRMYSGWTALWFSNVELFMFMDIFCLMEWHFADDLQFDSRLLLMIQKCNKLLELAMKFILEIRKIDKSLRYNCWAVAEGLKQACGECQSAYSSLA